MKPGKLYIICALCAWTLTGCGSMVSEANQPLLSAADANTMIRVEITPIEQPAAGEEIVAAAR